MAILKICSVTYKVALPDLKPSCRDHQVLPATISYRSHKILLILTPSQLLVERQPIIHIKWHIKDFNEAREIRQNLCRMNRVVEHGDGEEEGDGQSLSEAKPSTV